MTAGTEQSGREILQRMVFSRKRTTGGAIGFELGYELDDSVVELSVRLPENIEIEQTTGFAAAGDEWTWEAGSTDPVLSGTYHTDTTQSDGARYVDAGEWAIIKPPTHAASWRYRGQEPLDFVETYDVEDTGIASSNGAIVFLGEHERHQHSALGQGYTLAIPEAAELAVDPKSIFGAITDAASYLDVGESQEDILLVAAPSARAEWGPLGTQTGDDGIWALDRCPLARPNTTWIHEYVHTRQAPRCEPSMWWFTEGTACYYATLCSIRRGDIEFDTGQRFLDRTSNRGVRLTDPGTWPSEQIKYLKGRRVTAALDCEIRRYTDGVEDLRTVWAHLNETFETVDFGNFQTTLEETIRDPDPLLAWTGRYVDGTEIPGVPATPAAFGLSDANPQDPSDSAEARPGEPADPEPEEREPESDEPEGKTPEGGDPATDEPMTPEPEAGDPEGPGGEDIGEVCPICGAQTDEEYCPVCGTHVERACDVCGAQFSGDEQYCSRCGTER